MDDKKKRKKTVCMMIVNDVIALEILVFLFTFIVDTA